MNTRSSRTTVTFSNAFALSGYPGELPAGDYEVVMEEELLQGLSFEAWRRTATYLLVQGQGRRAGRTEMRSTTEKVLNEALSSDHTMTGKNDQREAVFAPPEDPK